MKKVFLFTMLCLIASACLAQTTPVHPGSSGNTIRSLAILRRDNTKAAGFSMHRLPSLPMSTSTGIMNRATDAEAGLFMTRRSFSRKALSGNRFNLLPVLHFNDGRSDYDFADLIHSLGALWLSDRMKK